MEADADMRRWQRATELFLAACGKAPDERGKFLDVACGDDPSLRAEVEKLLAADASAGEFLGDTSEVEVTGTRLPSLAGRTIGRYRLVRELGSGGMGVVYEAIQDRTEQTVALKVMKPGVASPSALRRFEFESRVLGQLRHPGIAQVYEAGTHTEGPFDVPFFAMEYLPDAETILQYARSNDLNIHQRLALLAETCDAVEHGHKKGIIHRDLKPGNILVDASGQPKVIDFGIARSTDSDLATTIPQTQGDRLIGTLQYMSPEQVSGEPGQVDTRSDVYSLGIVLYQLLSDYLPYDATGTSIDKAIRAIREDPPRKLPLADKALRGDVQTIVLKALEKEPQRRYQSAAELASDIRHHLAGEPIKAKGDSSWYVFRKTMWRHKVAAAVVLLIALSTLAIGKYVVTRAGSVALAESNEALARSNYGMSLGLAQVAHNADNIPRMKKLLAQCQPEHRGWEWHRLNWLSDRSLHTLDGPAGGIRGMSVSPNRRWMAVAGQDETLRVWDVSSTPPRCVVSQPVGHVRSLAFDTTGRRIAVGLHDETIRVLDATTGEEQLSLPCQRHHAVSLAFSLDGKRIVVGGNDGAAYVWDVQDGNELGHFRAHNGFVNALACHPAGNLMVTGGEDGRIRTWNVDGGVLVHTLQGHAGQVNALALSSDGSRILSGGVDRLVKLWNTGTGRLIQEFEGHGHDVTCVAFSPDGRQLASGCAHRTVRTWDAATGEELCRYHGHAGAIVGVAFTADGSMIVSSGSEGATKLWDAVGSDYLMTLTGHSNYVACVAVSPDSTRVASGSVDHTVRIWDARTGEELRTLHGHRGHISSVVFSPDGLTVVSSGGYATSRIIAWNAVTLDRIATLSCVEHRVMALAFSPDGALLASAEPHSLQRDGDRLTLWDTASWERVRVLSAPGHMPQAVAFSPDGRFVVSGGDDETLRVWDAQTGQELHQWDGQVGDVRFIAFGPTATTFVASGTGPPVILWDVETGRELRRFERDAATVESIAFSPDGARLISPGPDGTVNIWDTQSARELLTLYSGAPGVSTVAFAPDGYWIVAGCAYGELRIWGAAEPTLENSRRRRIVAAARHVVDPLYGELVFADAVLAELTDDGTLDPEVRQAAIDLVRARGDNPARLNVLAWDLVKWPGGSRGDHQRALQMAQAACAARPDSGGFLNTLGVAQYKLGQYDAALASLLRSEELFQTSIEGSDPGNLALIAMIRHHLNEPEQARKALELAIERFHEDQYQGDTAVTRSWIREAEDLITTARSKPPGSTVP